MAKYGRPRNRMVPVVLFHVSTQIPQVRNGSVIVVVQSQLHLNQEIIYLPEIQPWPQVQILAESVDNRLHETNTMLLINGESKAMILFKISHYYNIEQEVNERLSMVLEEL